MTLKETKMANRIANTPGSALQPNMIMHRAADPSIEIATPDPISFEKKSIRFLL